MIVLEKIRIHYSKINGIIDLPIMKIEKLYSDPDFAKKYIASSEHKLPNKEFIDLYLECIKINDRNAMLDNKTCTDCAEHDGEIYDIGKMPDVSHPMCRCFYEIYE